MKPNDNNNSGWIRRSVLDNKRVEETVEMYESIGFEVQVKELDPELLPEKDCKTCFMDNPENYKIIYTRKVD
jgi:hypothetical protein